MPTLSGYFAQSCAPPTTVSTNNIVAMSELTTRVVEGTTTVHVTVEVSSSLLLLPKQKMTGHFGSSKVEYFTTSLQHFGDAQQRTEKSHYITRWRMEPKPADRGAYLRGELVEPERPIVFYIDRSTPHRWRPYIKQGIEEWQEAFDSVDRKSVV